ncbi:BRCT domain-containing protein [Trypanosoma rangeli]|uniref:BRCT domain-containing protein n=1 Tax=Trypanosoma rangeli TaxID=5698 RepID=A0A422N7K6_TRYRA|nr:BRCT domain-containing protein [Trypanosoma rangeli]RNF01450.1 BRCT domain-containing protein [Trypanosoma rangeli]|eukprot:RNF01450.1 BRCT domain-containing protein [Trypanosoma rangeli]
MSSKQDRITDAMKERISQLESELSQCKHHLSEVFQQKESIECDIEALQKEAHDVVAQWVAKSTDLQTKLDASVSQVGVAKDELLLSKRSNEVLQRRLQDADETNRVQAEELSHLQKVQHDQAARLAAMEKDFFSASQQNIHYENLASKMDLEMKQVVEEMRSLIQEKNILIDAVAELKEENRSLEASCCETRNSIGKLENEVAEYKHRLHQVLAIWKLDQEERGVREEIVFQFGAFCLGVLWDKAKENINDKALLQKKHQTLEAEIDVLRKEISLYETEVQKKSFELSVLHQDHDKATSNLSQQIRLLEQDITELQDSQTNQNQIVEFLHRELENSTTQSERYKSLNEDLSTEFKAVKESYSSLLLEYNELKVCEERSQRELNAKIALLTDENKNIRVNYDLRLEEIMKENRRLLERLSFTEMESVKHAEVEARLIVKLSQSKEWSILLSDYSSQLVNCLRDNYGQILFLSKEVGLKESLLQEKNEMNYVLSEKLDALEKKVLLKQYEITQLESKMLDLSSELETSTTTCKEVTTDNTWLKEQVESMRHELGELDELLNFNLNEMREESERQQLEQKRLLQQIHRYEALLRQSQEKINSLGEHGMMLATDSEAISKTLLLTEGELLKAKEELAASHQREEALMEQKRQIESNLLQLQKKHVTVDSQTAVLQEQLQTQEAKLRLLSTSSRQEMEAVKIKLNSFIEKYEEAEARVSDLSKRIKASENIQSNLRESYQKAKAALEEAKQRCCKDTETIQKLLEERQSLEKERDTIVEKYNRVYDMLKSLKKDSVGKFADEAQKLSDLCFQQEVELQQLRHQNIMLKRGIRKLPVASSADNHIERPIFVERLNLTEGPLRCPKKRPSLN